MKSHILLFVLVSLFFGSQLSAQSASLASATTLPEITTPAPAELAVLAQQHNQLAVRQITDYLTANITYPKALEYYTLEGTVQLQVTLSRSGEIREVSVLSTELPEGFSEAAIEIMTEMKHLELDGGFYYGKTMFKVPLHFSL